MKRMTFPLVSFVCGMFDLLVAKDADQKMKAMCRLCGKVKSRLVDILSPEAGRHDLLVKIRAYINIVVSERDPFSKSVCTLCLGKLDYTCQFQDMCRSAQIWFRRRKDLEEETDRMTSELSGQKVRQLSTRNEVSSTGHNAFSSILKDAGDDGCRHTSPAFVETSSVNGDMSIDEDDVYESWPNRSGIISAPCSSEPYSSEPSQMEHVALQDATRGLIRPASPFESNDQDSAIFLPNNIHNIESENNKISVNDGSLVSTTRSEMPQNNLTELDILLSSLLNEDRFGSNDQDSAISLPNNIHNIESENNKMSVNGGSLVRTARSEMPQNKLSKLDMLLSSPLLNEDRFESNDQDSAISLPNNIHTIKSENNKMSVNDGSLVRTARSEMPQNNLSKLDMLLSSPLLNEVRQTNFMSSQNSESCHNMIAKAHLKAWLIAKSPQTHAVSIPLKLFVPEPSTLQTAASNTVLIQNGSSLSNMPGVCTVVACAEVPSWRGSASSSSPQTPVSTLSLPTIDVCTVVDSAKVPSWSGSASSSSPQTPVSTLGLPAIFQRDSSLQITRTADPSLRLNCDLKCISSAYPIESLTWHTSFSSPNVRNPVNSASSIFRVPSSESSAPHISSISKLTLSSSKTTQQDSLTLSTSVNQSNFVRKAHGVSTLDNDHIYKEPNAHTMMSSHDASIPVQPVLSTASFVSASSDVAITAQNGTTIVENNGWNDDTALNDNGTQTHSQPGLIQTCSYSDVNPTSKTASAIESNDQYFEDRACGWKKYNVGDTFKSRSNEHGSISLSYLGITHHLSRPSSTQLHKLPKCCLSCNASATSSFSCCYNLVSRRNLVLYCHACNQIFVKRNSYVDYYRLSECSKCDQKFPNSSLLWQHNQKYHVKNSFSCNDCGKTFDIKGHLVKHINSIHLNIKNHKCSKCDKTFRRRRTLVDHMDKHTGTPSYVCPTCGLMFYTHSLLASHKKMIHETEKPHKCNECDSAFKIKQLLKMHQLVHTGEKRFCCDQCGKSFARQFTLEIHVKCMHMPKSITCPLCPNMFSHKSNLKTHLNYHARLK